MDRLAGKGDNFFFDTLVLGPSGNKRPLPWAAGDPPALTPCALPVGADLRRHLLAEALPAPALGCRAGLSTRAFNGRENWDAHCLGDRFRNS